MRNLKVGDLVNGFLLINKEEINDIESVGYLFEHTKSGARLMYIDNEDDNKVFYIAFRTPPIDDCGTPHIIEHSVLCGSKKYPVKDPFNELAKGSLNTYLNALTYSDKTVYPVASRNDKDFNNLIDVYLDAVFNPLMLEHEEVFMQEGHHLHLENADDALCEKGVVYNEMKGAYSDPDRYMEGGVNTALFTDSPYRFESGGDPDKIPDLTYEQFIEFYKYHYHPSNSYIYLFGKMDIEEKLKYLDTEYLSSFNKLKIDTEIKHQTPVGSVIRREEKYPIIENDGSGKEAMYAAGYITSKSYDSERNLGYSILSYILLDTNASPLRKALTESGFSSNAEGWFDSSLLDSIFTISAKGAKEAAADEFEKIVTDTLESILKKGLDKDLVNSAVNAFEFMLSEENYGYKPRGLAYGLKAMDSWLHIDNPFDNFRFKKHIATIRREAENGFFEQLIADGFVNNPTKVFLSLQAEEGMQAKLDAAERDKFDKLKKEMSGGQIAQIEESTKNLLKFQSAEDDLSVMPFLKLDDISKKADVIDNEVKENIIFVPQSTNGIVYSEMAFDINDMPNESYNYLGLLCELVGKLDTEKFSFSELPTQTDMYTGGINAVCSGYMTNQGEIKRIFNISAKALDRNIEMLAELIDETTNKMLFDKTDNISLIIKDTVSRLEGYLTNSGHITAANRALSYYNDLFKFKDETNGIGFFKFLCALDKNFESEKDNIVKNLKAAAKSLFTADRLLLALSCEECDFEKSSKLLGKIFKTGKSGFNIIGAKENLSASSEGIITPGKIQYVAKAVNYHKEGFNFSGKLFVLKNIIDLEYLWNTVRVQGGAYGCGCNFLKSGNLYMYSYRDPNLTRTLDIYDAAGEFIKNFDANERSMTNYIIGAVNNLDKPLNKEQKLKQVLIRFIAEISDEMLQNERDEVLSSTCEQMRGYAPLLETIKTSKYICVMGNGDNINNKSELFERIINLKGC
ncbi:MAG: insulinase family protein [Candidatus Metalachnospira sp.]|nr:insulinase family protein [Candidatus Metalachnospira sp.]